VLFITALYNSAWHYFPIIIVKYIHTHWKDSLKTENLYIYFYWSQYNKINIYTRRSAPLHGQSLRNITIVLFKNEISLAVVRAFEACVHACVRADSAYMWTCSYYFCTIFRLSDETVSFKIIIKHNFRIYPLIQNEK